jgi:hypothetical protein
MLCVAILYCYAEHHNSECFYAECQYAECHNSECFYAERHYAECCGIKFISIFTSTSFGRQAFDRQAFGRLTLPTFDQHSVL